MFEFTRKMIIHLNFAHISGTMEKNKKPICYVYRFQTNNHDRWKLSFFLQGRNDKKEEEKKVSKRIYWWWVVEWIRKYFFFNELLFISLEWNGLVSWWGTFRVAFISNRELLFITICWWCVSMSLTKATLINSFLLILIWFVLSKS